MEEKLKNLENKFMLKLTKEELNEVISELNTLTKKLDNLKDERVEPLYFPYENKEASLREDSDFLKMDDVLKYAPLKEGKEVKVPKVVS